MMKSALRSRWTRVTTGCLLGLGLLAGSVNLGLAADDEEDVAADKSFMRSLLKGLGLRGDDGPGIDYRERSPLVVPPVRNLPAPETSGPKSTAWPNDPDVKRVRETKAARRAYNPNPEEIRPELPSQYSRNAPASPASAPTAGDKPDPNAPVRPSELGYTTGGLLKGFFQKKEEYATFTGEPPRSSLIEPPSGYRTPSPAQPYGVGTQRWDSSQAPERHIPAR
jgi:hypothetical protein